MNTTEWKKETNNQIEELVDDLKRAFTEYGEKVVQAEKNLKPGSGLFGVGLKLQDDSCHEELEEQLGGIVSNICGACPSPEDAARVVRLLLWQDEDQDWPLAARWMLRAVGRHTLLLIPLLNRQDAAEILREYSVHYRRWDRLPIQKAICQALRNRAAL